jgi:uncharacterized protein (DUF433 family)
MKIHVITGWVIPVTSELYTILKDQFQKKITEDYGELNPDEIEFAFRSTWNYSGRLGKGNEFKPD